MLSMAKLINDQLDKPNPLKVKVIPQTRGWKKTLWKDLQTHTRLLPYQTFTREALEKWNHGLFI